MRTAGPKWDHAKLYGKFPALWFLLMKKDGSEKREVFSSTRMAQSALSSNLRIQQWGCLSLDNFWKWLLLEAQESGRDIIRP